MRSGPNIHPVTRKPVREKPDPGAREAMELHRLRAQADRLQMQEDPVLDVIMGRLTKRAEYLINEDPEAQGLLTVLNDIGHEVNLAQRAVTELARRAGLKGER